MMRIETMIELIARKVSKTTSLSYSDGRKGNNPGAAVMNHNR